MITTQTGTNLCVEHYVILKKCHEQPENKMKLMHGTKHENDLFTRKF